jgi:hypothetical protein
MTTSPSTDLPLGCAICGAITRHWCPYPLAPIGRWECEYAAEHAVLAQAQGSPLHLVRTAREQTPN